MLSNLVVELLYDFSSSYDSYTLPAKQKRQRWFYLAGAAEFQSVRGASMPTHPLLDDTVRMDGMEDMRLRVLGTLLTRPHHL